MTLWTLECCMLAAVRHHTFVFVLAPPQYKVKDMTQADFGRLEIDLAYVFGWELHVDGV